MTPFYAKMEYTTTLEKELVIVLDIIETYYTHVKALGTDKKIYRTKPLSVEFIDFVPLPTFERSRVYIDSGKAEDVETHLARNDSAAKIELTDKHPLTCGQCSWGRSPENYSVDEYHWHMYYFHGSDLPLHLGGKQEVDYE